MSKLKNKALSAAAGFFRRDAAKGGATAETSAATAARIAGKIEIAPGTSVKKGAGKTKRMKK